MNDNPPAPSLEASGQVSSELAMRDMQDITELRKNEAFNRYFMRRIQSKRDEAEKKFKYEPVDKCSAGRREEYRQIMLTLEDVATMMKNDEAGIRSVLSSPTNFRK